MAFYRIKVLFNSTCQLYESLDDNIKRNLHVVIPTCHGLDFGLVLGPVTTASHADSQDPIAQIERIATEADMKRFHDNQRKQSKTFQKAKKKIKDHNLDMKLVSVYHFFEEPKILFNFTANERIDFRELVKDLANMFKTRIELRQIGVRDEARIHCGIGLCGRQFCCSGLIDELKPVYIKMAKEQNLTLNSLKISGVCGRLLCCLAYENDLYLELKKDFPSEGWQIKLKDEITTVCEINVQTRKVKVITSDHRILTIPVDYIKLDKENKKGVVVEEYVN